MTSSTRDVTQTFLSSARIEFPSHTTIFHLLKICIFPRHSLSCRIRTKISCNRCPFNNTHKVPTVCWMRLLIHASPQTWSDSPSDHDRCGARHRHVPPLQKFVGVSSGVVTRPTRRRNTFFSVFRSEYLCLYYCLIHVRESNYRFLFSSSSFCCVRLLCYGLDLSFHVCRGQF